MKLRITIGTNGAHLKSNIIPDEFMPGNQFRQSVLLCWLDHLNKWNVVNEDSMAYAHMKSMIDRGMYR